MYSTGVVMHIREIFPLKPALLLGDERKRFLFFQLGRSLTPCFQQLPVFGVAVLCVWCVHSAYAYRRIAVSRQALSGQLRKQSVAENEMGVFASEMSGMARIGGDGG